jgi:hypothetical protein
MRKNEIGTDLTEYYTLAQRAGYSHKFTEHMLTAGAENGKSVSYLCDVVREVINVVEDSTLTD